MEVEDLPVGYRDSALVCLKRTLPLNQLLHDFVPEMDMQARDVRLKLT